MQLYKNCLQNKFAMVLPDINNFYYMSQKIQE